MIIDFRGRPATPEFSTYFNPSRVEWIAKRVGARGVSEAYLNSSLEMFIDEMDEAGINLTVAVGRNSPEVTIGGRTFPAGIIPNDHLVDLQRAYPDRIVGFAGIDVSNTLHDAIEEIDRYVRDGELKGVFVEPQRAMEAHLDDARLNPVYEKCIELDVPVVVMTGPFAGANIALTDPAHIDGVASRFPDLKIVAGHGCWPYVAEIVAVAFKHQNVFVSPDLYTFVAGAALYVEAANTFMADQFLFATAYPLRPLIEIVEDFMALPLSDEARDKALFGNAMRLLKMEQ